MKSKFEQLIEHIINDEEDRAREMFHNLVVEKSREIYNELVAEEVEMDDEEDEEEEMEESFVPEMDTDQTDDMMGDISSDEEGMGMDDMGDDDMDDMDDMSDMDDEEDGDIEDRVMDLEDALDELQRDFQKIMNHEAGEEGEKDEKEMPDNMMREYTEKVSVSHNDGSDNSKSPVANKNDMGGSAKNIAQGGSEQDPDGKQYKKPSNQYTKGEGNLPGAGSFENVPGAKAGKAFSNAKKPVSKDAASGTHSPVAKN